MSRDYWSGRPVSDYTLTSFGKPWNAEPLAELLYAGTVEFYDQSFVNDSPSIGMARVLSVNPSDIMKKFLRKREES